MPRKRRQQREVDLAKFLAAETEPQPESTPQNWRSIERLLRWAELDLAQQEALHAHLARIKRLSELANIPRKDVEKWASGLRSSAKLLLDQLIRPQLFQPQNMQFVDVDPVLIFLLKPISRSSAIRSLTDLVGELTDGIAPFATRGGRPINF